ncbi:hypothetical protein SAMN05414139_01474 [Burkholderia sp. D7]|nr:hypothetical protein SAMN05414139_01474 [Burkholderia sp. D7]
MAAAPHPQRDAAIATIRNLRAFHGPDEGERQARAKFPDVPKGTFSGWVKLARLPAEQVPAPAHSSRAYAPPASDNKPLTFEERIAAIDRHVAMVVEASTREVVDTDSGDVRRVARNPSMLATAVRLQSQACELLVRYAATVSDMRKSDEFYGVVLEALGEASPEVQRAVFDRLRAVNEQQDGARLGLGLGHALPAVSTPASHPEVDF